MPDEWTPGPWVAGGIEEVYGAAVSEDNPRGLTLAAVADHGLGFEGQSEANARLIAAAPEMAEIGSELVAAIQARIDRGDSVGGEVDSFADALAAVLKRVRGEA